MVKKLEKLIFIIGLVLAIAVPMLYREYNMRNEYVTSKPVNSEELSYVVESVEQTAKYVAITGWVVKEGVATSPYIVHVLLWNEEGQVGYEREAMMQTRDDITTSLNQGVNYGKAGFKAVFSLENQRISAGVYRVVIMRTVAETEYYVYTDTYIEVTDNG